MGDTNPVINRARALLAKPAPLPRQYGRPPLIKPIGRAQARGRLVFAVDATGSREEAWKAAQRLTDAFFMAVPGGLDVALAVHGGGRLRMTTPFTSDPNLIRHAASSIRCEVGYTRLLDILRFVLNAGEVGVLVYVGDSFEEDAAEARHLADALKRRGTRVIILHDRAPTFGVKIGTSIFEEIAERTGGTVLPFDTSSLQRLRELLAAIAMLAVGGPKLLAANEQTMPGARRLLERLGERPSASRQPSPLTFRPR